MSRFSDFKRCSIVVAERRCFFLTSSILLIENLQNRFFQLYNCNNHTAINVHMDSQDDLNMTKASNFAENRRNRKIHTKPVYMQCSGSRGKTLFLASSFLLDNISQICIKITLKYNHFHQYKREASLHYINYLLQYEQKAKSAHL